MVNQLSTSEIISLMDSARFDSAGQLRNVIRRYNEVVNGNYRLVDPTSPLLLVMEMACAGAANATLHHEAEARRHHPMLALTKEDLYFHLTDRQYVDIFSVPPQTTMGLIIPIEDIEENAVEVGNSGVRKLVLGKNTAWRVGPYDFTLEYPIEFTITPGGGLSVGFGTPVIPALHRVDSNIIEMDEVNYQGYPSVRLSFPIRQQTISNEIIRINAASASLGNIRYSDKFHYCRAFIRQAGKWVEIRTTHSEHVYDPLVPTLLVRDIGGELKLTLPVVYHTMGLLGSEIRLDIYTTRAMNDVILSEFTDSQWQVEPRDFDNTDNGVYTAPFERMNTIVSFSGDYTRGGRDELSFEELRRRITEVHYGNVVEPITSVNHELKLSDLGFSTVKSVDGVTTRTFNATRTMPLPTDGYLSSPINVGVFNMILQPDQLSEIEGISINGDITTIHPKVLFKEVEGSVRLVLAGEREQLEAAEGDVLARLVSNTNYLFTPFYNVIDSTTNNFELRTYHLDSPEVLGREFVLSNPTLLLDLYTSQGVTLEKANGGYVINIQTSSGDAYKNLRDDQVGVQLSYYPPNQTVPVVVLGALVAKDEDGNRVWSFNIETNYSIDNEDALQVLNFITLGNGETPSRMPLSLEFDLCYFVNDYPVSGIVGTDIDRIINQQEVPVGSWGIVQERLKVSLGERVTNLWTGARPLVTPQDYEVYDHDMPKLYDKPVYRRDENGELVVNEVNGNLTVEKIHDVGDPVLDEATGQPVYLYRKGEVVTEDGLPVIKNPRKLARQLDLVLFDGLFAFANDRSSVNYVNYVRRNIVQWSRDDMATANKTALENTVVKFRPMTTIGSIDVVVGEGGDITMDARQSMTVKFLMTETAWKNNNLKEGLRKLAIDTIDAEFDKTNVSISNIVTALKLAVPSDVMGIEVLGLGGEENNYPLISLKDGSGQPSIRMKLVALPSGEYTVEEDINVLFVPHLPARSDK